MAAMVKARGCTVAVTVLLLVVSACRSTNLAAIGTGGRFSPEDDESQLWTAARQAEEKLLGKAVYEDPRLETYLNGLVRQIAPSGYREAGGPELSVKVRRDPRLNAMPHGTIVLHSGIVARADNESQLVAVLAHELSHITHRHQIREARAVRNRQTAINVVALLGTLALAVAAADQAGRGNYGTAQALASGAPPLLGFGLQLTYTAMVSGYSRDMEREADEQGMRVMAKPGHDPRELKGFLEKLLADGRDRGAIETFFYGSHPRVKERIETVDEVARTLNVASNRIASGDDFERTTVRVRVANAEFDALIGRTSLAQAQAIRAAATVPVSARPVATRLLDGHLASAASFGLAQRGNADEARRRIDDAERAYRQAIALGSGDSTVKGLVAFAYRGIGGLYYGQRTLVRRDCEAKTALERYLELAPAAADIGDVRRKIADLTC